MTGILLLVAVSALVGRPRRPAAMTPRIVATAGAIALVCLAFLFNGILLIQGRSLFLLRADMTRALEVAGLRRPLPVETDPARTLVLVPSPIDLQAITAAYGDPRGDALVPFGVRPVPPAVQAEADRRVREGAEIPLRERP